MTEKMLISRFSFSELADAVWEQRPVGPSCFPAEPDELISKQNSQDSVKEFII